ncbi:MAG: A24 family peptidase [Nanoarchaeota archaeon]
MEYIAGLPSIISFVIAFIVLLIGSITDLKTREVPDWVNYGLIISGIGLNLLFSIILNDKSYIINSIVGLSIFFGIAYFMFYAGQWGGGDSKMLMGLGAMIGINFEGSQFLFGFLINALIIGAFYGIFWSFYLALRDKKAFTKELKRILSKQNVMEWKKVILTGCAIALISSFFIGIVYVRIAILSVAFMVLTTFYVWIFVKSIEKSSMYRLVEPYKLTEGDWIVKDVYIGKTRITGPKDLGIEKKNIKILIEAYKKRKIGKILIKEGIPFVPSFFIAYILTFIIGNPIWLLF